MPRAGGQVAAVLVAVLMNQAIRGIAILRTLYFVPSVVSGVALATLWVMVFDPDKGVLNRALNVVLNPFGLSAPDWFGADAEAFAIPAFVLMALWGVGAGMVIYLAGLKGIPGSLYEAARIDGAGKIKQFFHITLPMIAIVAIYTFMYAWNDFMGPLIYLNSPENRTLALALNAFNGQDGVSDVQLLMAASFITMLPCIALFFAAQRYFVDTGAASGLKG